MRIPADVLAGIVDGRVTRAGMARGRATCSS